MGWFSDALFGERKRMDPNKVNDFMAEYDAMAGQQKEMASQMMDPNSVLNRERQQSLRSNQMDMLSVQNQGLLGAAAQTGASPGQLQMQQSALRNKTMGNFGSQMQDMYSQQHSAGLGLFGQAMGAQQGIGERGANMYMQQINEANARRQQNMQMTASLAGTALSFAAPFIPQPKPPNYNLSSINELKDN